MIPEELHKLDAFIKENRSFAVYRIPEDTKIHLIVQDSEPACFDSIEDLNGKTGFVVAPYNISDACPLVLIQAPHQEISFSPKKFKLQLGQSSGQIQYVPVDKEYAQAFDTFSSHIKEKMFKKLVLSRSITLEKGASFSPVEAFVAACVKYTRSYVYLCHTPQSGTWLGSTPEMLLSGKGNMWNTVAIAGTQPLQNDKLPTNWDDKNLIEQMLVAYYIRTQLSSFNIHAVEKDPYTVKAGGVAHLRSDYHFSLPNTDKLGDLLHLLHPTPAVSGLPKEEARRFILENEGYDRRYYSGFVGWLEPEGKTDLYVNLRCMHIKEDAFTLYAGGGLLPSSVLADEWKETEDKIQTMLFLTKTDNYVFK